MIGGFFIKHNSRVGAAFEQKTENTFGQVIEAAVQPVLQQMASVCVGARLRLRQSALTFLNFILVTPIHLLRKILLLPD